ncbi:MAG TPA: hypothetical protein VH372_12900 [Actinospica sp.]|jgi:hypothetical protein|nr:hypothetical protein [Actinospica sp.]
MPLITDRVAAGLRPGARRPVQAAEPGVPRPRGGRPGDPPAEAPPDGGHHRRGLRAVGWALGLLTLAALLVRVSLTVGMDADAANKALQGWDLLHGHLLLHGWITGDATFYALESPLYALVEAFTGLTPMVTHVEPALLYVLVLVLVLPLCRGEAAGWAAALRGLTAAAILLIPLASTYGVSLLMEQPDHVGTSVFLLAAFLLADAAGRRRGWRDGRFVRLAPFAVFAVCTAGILSDDTVTYVAVPAVALVCGLRGLQARRPLGPDAGVGFAALLAIPAEHVLRAVMHRFGSYWMTRPRTVIAGPAAWPSHAHRTLRAVAALYGLSYNGSLVFAVLGGCSLGAAAAGFVRVLWRWRTASRAELLCVTAILLNLAVYSLSTGHTPIPAHEIAAVLPLGAVLAARCISPAWTWWRSAARKACVLLAVAALAPVIVSAARPAQGPIPTAPAPNLAGWLAAHGLRYGIAGYWDASTITVDSGGAVAVRAVVQAKHGFAMYAWETRRDWYQGRLHDATFAVAYDGPSEFGLINADKLGTANFEAFLGKPAEVYRVDGRSVLVYPANLLDHVAAWLPARAKRQ